MQLGHQKRSGFTSGLIKAGEKLLDDLPGGFLIEMDKTIAKPIYNWMISTDKDPVMEKFTNHMISKTQFRGHHDEHKISSNAQQGDGATVWQSMSIYSMMWNRNKILVMTRKTYIFNAERMSS